MVKKLALSTLGAVDMPLRALGVQVVRNRQTNAGLSHRIRQLARAGFRPAVAFDGGAFSADWSRAMMDMSPRCRMTVAEPNPDTTGMARHTRGNAARALRRRARALTSGAPPGCDPFAASPTRETC